MGQRDKKKKKNQKYNRDENREKFRKKEFFFFSVRETTIDLKMLFPLISFSSFMVEQDFEVSEKQGGV